jgi:Protein of unknown function (DUF2752)
VFSLFKKFPLEALVWLIALVTLALIDPHASHYSLCPLKNMGFTFCPGCGLGTSISFLFRGDVHSSFASHPLGIFAVIILSFRIITLIRKYFKTYGPTN